jgi:4-amino-4-deoxy-L-arabinose transferase-like glycosyltransferase
MRQANESTLLSALSSPYFVPVCFVFYLTLRLTIIVFVPIDQQSDQLWYYNRAVEIASGRGYSERGILTAYWPVGWPGFMGLLFQLLPLSPFTAQIANLVLAAVTFFLALSLGSVLFADKMVGRLTVLILTLYPNQIGYVPSLATEVFYTALLLLAIFIGTRSQGPKMLLLSGVVFGIATLTKPQTLFLPAVLFAAWWFVAPQRRRFLSHVGKATVVYAAMAVVILPWTARNYLVFGEFVLISTNGGGTFLAGNNPTAWGDDTEDDPVVKQVRFDVVGQVAADRLATSLALKWIHDNPGAFAILVLSVVSTFFFVRGWRTLSPYAVTGYALAAYFTAISIVFSGQSRFHFPVMPWFAMYAAWVIVLRTRENQQEIAPLSRISA